MFKFLKYLFNGKPTLVDLIKMGFEERQRIKKELTKRPTYTPPKIINP